MPRPVRVLIVDDSALIRQILAAGLGADPEIEVVGTAGDPYQARDRLQELEVDVLTLDVEMPRMDGVAFLKRLMPQYPLPVVMVSALTERGKSITLDALEAGAVDFVTKPKADVARGLQAMMQELRGKVKAAAGAKVTAPRHTAAAPVQAPLSAGALAESTDKVVAIGASTGGTEAIRTVITRFPLGMPGVVIVQHMPAGFTRMFAERMDSLCAIEVKEAEDGDRIRPGRALIAPGGQHLQVKRSGGIYVARVAPGELTCGHCPSVEVLMQSVAKAVGSNAIGVMLTGMGRDGATGMKAMREAGARCFAQDEASSVVFGMPKEAHACGGAEQLVPLEQMADTVLAALRQSGTAIYRRKDS